MPVLECVVNISEGRDDRIIDAIAASGGWCVLDVHRDADHHRSVLTMAGDEVEEAVRAVVSRSVELIDLTSHQGVHPRFGAADVVPFVPLDDNGTPRSDDDLGPALSARSRFGTWAAQTLGLPCFFYGPGRSLPDVRRHAFATLLPDAGPHRADPRTGACAVGARHALIAYNVWLETTDLTVAKALAASVRSPTVRALGLAVGEATQVSCNLIDPWTFGPAQLFDAVVGVAGNDTPVSRAELVGLAPAAVVRSTPEHRWAELDLDPDRTIEARLDGARGAALGSSGG